MLLLFHTLRAASAFKNPMLTPTTKSGIALTQNIVTTPAIMIAIFARASFLADK